MKKLQILFSAFCFLLPTLRAQEMQQITVWKNGNVIYNSNLSVTDSLIFSSINFPNSSDGVLINGVTWATCNVDMPGTFASQPNEAGMFYQWNRNIGWSSKDPMVNSNGGTVWDPSIPAGNSWEAANNPCPTGWRLPTSAEHQSLIDSGSFWDEMNGVAGRFFGSGTQIVFFPAAGCRYDNSGLLTDVGFIGSYWSGEPSTNYDAAYTLFFYNIGVNTFYGDSRSFGFSVRCVSE